MDEWMRACFADHLDLARCSALIAAEDLGCGVVALGGSLALLQRDLLALAAALEADSCAKSCAKSSVLSTESHSY